MSMLVTFSNGEQIEQWLVLSIVLTGTILLVTLITLLARRRNRPRTLATNLQLPFIASELSSEQSYNFLHENEMPLRLKLAQHYLDIDDLENGIPLLEAVRWHGQQSEKDLAEKLLNEFLPEVIEPKYTHSE